ncbi:MAG: phosphate ABC transporter permease subunit PstC [Kineosporiaceae bacterium]|jgi:phosphate transport system permease protein
MTTSGVAPAPVAQDAAVERRVKPSATAGPADRLFAGIARLSGSAVLLVMGTVGLFLGVQAAPAIREAGWGFLTTQAWEPGAGPFGIAAILFGTLMIGLVAILVAVPFSIATALYISEYAPARLQRTFISLVDLMAAVPSVVYGLWGVFLLQEKAVGVAQWLSVYLGWIPLFHVPDRDPRDPLASLTDFKSSIFMAGIVVAMMVTPIASSVMREAFAQAPQGEREGAYALGATRWGMIRDVVLPFGRGAVIGGTMLGLGRALGETITVAMIVSPVFEIQWNVLEKGAISVSALIALRYGEAEGISLSALFAAGLALFLTTMAVNFAASVVVSRSRSGAASEA